jgi:hypothetical protein
MPNLSLLAKLPEIKSAVLADKSGVFIDSLNEPDGETTAAVVGFISTLLGEAGDQLGLGTLRGVACTSVERASVIRIEGDAVLTAFVDPKVPVATVEKKLDGVLQG